MFVRYRTFTGRALALVVGALALISFGYYVLPAEKTSSVIRRLPFPLSSLKDVDWSSSEVCRIPRLEKDRPEVARLYKHVEPVQCAEKCGANWLVVDDEGRVQLTEFARSRYGVTALACEWAFFDRLDDRRLTFGERLPLRIGEKVTRGDFFAADCTAERDGSKWHGLFMTVAARPERLAQLKAIKRPAGWSGLNVYVLGFDSVSQMEFRRKMPKTVEFLERTMRSSVFNGFNIVGDGTPQAYIPFLTGRTEVELPLTRKRYRKANYVDDVYPFAWRNFSDAGYATLYGEDEHNVGTFTYRLKGFRRQPTDHFPITFFQRFEGYCHERSVRRECCRRCVGDVPQHQIWLRYAESFWREYAEVPRFLLMHHSSLSHDSMDDLELADEDLRNHLRRMYERGAFADTMVVVMADHGRRFSAMRETQQGQLEERLPFFSVYLPPENRTNKAAGGSSDASAATMAAAVANVRANAADRLASHFDVHATLMQLVSGWPSTPSGFESPAAETPPPRSMSLFSRIPANRTCEMAGIEEHWCTCLQWRDALADGAKAAATAQELAHAVVHVFNNQTASERSVCAKLGLKRLIRAKMLVPDAKMLSYAGNADLDGFVPKFGGKARTTVAIYQLVLETTPGGGKYEVTVHYDSGAANTVTVDLKSASHINPYGDQPHCVIDRNYFLAAYCVCYDRIKV